MSWSQVLVTAQLPACLCPCSPQMRAPAMCPARFWPDFWTNKPGVWDVMKLYNDDPWKNWIDAWDDALDTGGDPSFGHAPLSHGDASQADSPHDDSAWEPTGLDGRKLGPDGDSSDSAGRGLQTITVLSPPPPPPPLPWHSVLRRQTESGQIVLNR